MSRTPKQVSIGIVECALPVPRRGSIDALSSFSSGPQIGAEMHQRVQARRRRKIPCNVPSAAWRLGCSGRVRPPVFPFQARLGPWSTSAPSPARWHRSPWPRSVRPWLWRAGRLSSRTGIGRDPVPERAWWPGSQEWPVPGSDGPSSLAGPAWRCAG